jgi:hypothetical protein
LDSSNVVVNWMNILWLIAKRLEFVKSNQSWENEENFIFFISV